MSTQANPPTMGRIFSLCLTFAGLLFAAALFLALPSPSMQTGSATEALFPVVAAAPPAATPVVASGLLPSRRIVAYYGNFYSTKMGALGEYPEDACLNMLHKEVDAWTKADPATPAIAAIHYIAVTAQASPGKDGKYRLRMPDSQIERAIAMAQKIGGLVFLDIQVGLSTLQDELPRLEKYLSLPQVHLGIDPEFSMKTGHRPGTRIGSFDAKDINYTSNYLAKLVQQHNLPPKILIVHRFTQAMVTNWKAIATRPETQIVIAMDGWGNPQMKTNIYKTVVADELPQFSGLKLFYKNDLKLSPHRLLAPEELLKLKPTPLYIQYQ